MRLEPFCCCWEAEDAKSPLGAPPAHAAPLCRGPEEQERNQSPSVGAGRGGAELKVGTKGSGLGLLMGALHHLQSTEEQELGLVLPPPPPGPQQAGTGARHWVKREEKARPSQERLSRAGCALGLSLR